MAANPPKQDPDAKPPAAPEPEPPNVKDAGGKPIRSRVPAGIDQPAPGPGEPSGYHPPAPPFMSQGVLNDLRQYGETRDPNTGRTLTEDDIPPELR